MRRANGRSPSTSGARSTSGAGEDDDAETSPMILAPVLGKEQS